LVTREIRRKKAADANTLKKALSIAREIEVPAESLMKESTIEAAQKVVELTRSLQELVVADEILKTAEDVQRKEVTCLEADASEATGGNTDSHTTSNHAIEIESSPPSNTLSTSVSTSSDIDDIPLNKVYAHLQKALSPSSSTKHLRKHVADEFEPMYPSIVERIGEMAQIRIDVCARLPAEHPFQPPFIQPLQSIHANAKVEKEQAMPDFDVSASTSTSQPQPITQTSDPSVLDELANHYSGELPGIELNLEKAFEIASDEVVS
jgi:hypothetical protein